MIDFSVRPGRGAGASIDVAPGHSECDWGAGINIDEDAFFLIESLASDALPLSSQIDHYGPGAIEAHYWSQALTAIEAGAAALSASIYQENYNTQSITRLPWIAPHGQIQQQIQTEGVKCIQDIVEMLEDFSKINRTWLTKYPNVFYSGV